MVPKDLDVVYNILITLSLPEGVSFKGTAIGRIPTMKFEDWDLANTEKFPHLETNKLMEWRKEGDVTTLQP